MDNKRLDWFDNVEARTHPWPGLNWLTAMLYVPDCEAAIKFYEEAFYFVPIFQIPDNKGTTVFARMRYRGNNFTISKEGFPGYERYKSPKTCKATAQITFYVYVDDADKAIAHAEACGCKLLQPVELQFWGDRKGTLEDPYGYIWELATRVQ
jgi:PhnB protein